MFVSRKSWHYRLHSFVFTFFNFENEGPVKAFKGEFCEHKPKSLCTYFWSTFILTSLLPLAIVVMGVFTLLAISFAGLFFGPEKIEDAYRRWRPRQGPARKGLLAQYLAARKSKVCPLITIVD